VALHEEAINEMWNRSLKGQAAADCLRQLLAALAPPGGRILAGGRRK
jgi:hypothetical protein